MKVRIAYNGKKDSYSVMVFRDNKWEEVVSASILEVNGEKVVPVSFVTTLIQAVREGCQFVY